jgi:dihydroxyacetone kinase-like protein
MVKKIINDPETVVLEALRGMQAAHPDLLRVQTEPPVVVRADAPVPRKVAVISGGGSGHEPLHAGFVGKGMLDAACPGAVFTSPTPDQVASAVSLTDGGAGALLIVKNYTGDVLNFETAAELAAAEGTEVRSVVIDDDVAVKDSLYTAGRRGVGGTVLLEKIVGAAAERGVDLKGCEALAERVISQVRSMGLALTAPTVPHVGEPSFSLADDEMEIGIGIHGEPGRQRVAVTSADEMVRRLLEPIVEDLPFGEGDRVLLFTNSMGGTPLLELYLAHGIAEKFLADRGIRVERRLVGPFITSLEMQGISFTVLRLDDEMIQLWDAPVHTPALRWGV